MLALVLLLGCACVRESCTERERTRESCIERERKREKEREHEERSSERQGESTEKLCE